MLKKVSFSKELLLRQVLSRTQQERCYIKKVLVLRYSNKLFFVYYGFFFKKDLALLTRYKIFRAAYDTLRTFLKMVK
jgi:hypothetical protein